MTSKAEAIHRTQVANASSSTLRQQPSKRQLQELVSSKVAREALEQDSSSDEDSKRPLKRCNAMPYPFPSQDSREKPFLSPTRTVVSRGHCSNLFPGAIDQSEGRITLLSQSYKMLETGPVNFSGESYVSIGAYPQSSQRELLLFDTKASSQAEDCFRKLETFFLRARDISSHRVISIIRVIRWTMEHTEKALVNKSNEKVAALIASWEGEQLELSSGASIPLIPIDFFIKHQTGVCRHRALLFAYLFAELVRKYPDCFSGATDVLYYRATLARAGHAWVCVKDGSGRVYSVDPTLGKIIAIEQEMFSCSRSPLESVYGREAALEFIQRVAPEFL